MTLQMPNATTATSATATSVFYVDFTKSDPSEPYKRALRMVVNVLGPVYSPYNHEHHAFDNTDLDIDIALEYALNALCGLPEDAHYGKTRTEARKNGRRARQVWHEHGFTVGKRKGRKS